MRFVSLFSCLILASIISAPFAQSDPIHRSEASRKSHGEMVASTHNEHRNTTTRYAPTSHWSAPAAEKARPNPVPMTREGLMEAGELYRENCAACHGTEGLGNGPIAEELDGAPANLFAMAQHHADGDLRWKIAKGRSEMPGWEGVLSDEQIWLLVHYMKSLPAYHIVKRSEEQ